MRELFVHYRVARGDLPAALDAARAMQQRLKDAAPDLQSRLLQRPDTGGPELTLMETYRREGDEGVSPAHEDRIAELAAHWAGLRSSARHTETFVPCA